jgi:cytochrome P450
MGGQELVIVEGFEPIKELLLKPQFNYRPDFFRINTYRQNAGFGFSEPNQSYKRLRKSVHMGIRAYGPGLCRMNRILGHIGDSTMAKFAAETGKGGFDPWNIIYEHMLRSMTAFTLGENVQPTEELYHVVAKLDKLAMQVLSPVGIAATLDTAPWLRHLGHPTWKQALELMETRNELWRIVRPGLQSCEEASIASLFLQSQRDVPEIDDERVKCAIGDMMIAGTVTTSMSTYFLLHLLCHHPEIQRKLQDEIDAVLGSSATASLDDMVQMPYTRATMFELQRYMCVNPLGLPHCAGEEGGTIAGQTIPKGTNLLPNIWSVLYDETFWTNPEQFNPERFLTADGELVGPEHPNRRRLLAFGFGARLCPGENFAYSRIFMFTTALLKCITVSIDPSSAHVPYEPRTFSLTLGNEPHPYRLMMAVRQPSRDVYRRAGEA